MSTVQVMPRSVKIIRWIARIWSLLIFVFVVIRLFLPDPNATEPVPAEDWFLLSLWGVSVLGLLVAWRWEPVGAIITIASMLFREIMWVVLRGSWWVNFLLLWAVVLPPAVLFLIAWGLERKAKKA
jgi:hypothetical protein